VRPEGLGQLTPPGIEPATIRLVAQCLNQLRHRVPRSCNHSHATNTHQNLAHHVSFVSANYCLNSLFFRVIFAIVALYVLCELRDKLFNVAQMSVIELTNGVWERCCCVLMERASSRGWHQIWRGVPLQRAVYFRCCAPIHK